MQTCTFFRINNNVYNANVIKQISILDNNPGIKCFELCRVIVYFHECINIPPVHFYTYHKYLGQTLFDWQHGKSNYFELLYLTDEDAEHVDKKWRERIRKDAEKRGESIDI